MQAVTECQYVNTHIVSFDYLLIRTKNKLWKSPRTGRDVPTQCYSFITPEKLHLNNAQLPVVAHLIIIKANLLKLKTASKCTKSILLRCSLHVNIGTYQLTFHCLKMELRASLFCNAITSNTFRETMHTCCLKYKPCHCGLFYLFRWSKSAGNAPELLWWWRIPAGAEAEVKEELERIKHTRRS